MKLLNNLVSFLLELAMLGALIFWGFHVGNTTAAKWLLGAVVPLAVIVFWSFFMAPQASSRIAWPWLPVISLVLFLISALALYVAGMQTAAIILAIVAVVNVVLVFVWHQY